MKSRIFHTGDVHLDAHNRFDETMSIIEWMHQIGSTVRFRPDLWVWAGDSLPVAVRPSLPRERIALRDHWRRMADVAPVVVIKGNHDHAEWDLEVLDSAGVHVFSAPDVRMINGIAVGTLPWPSKGWLLKQVPEGTSGADLDDTCRKALTGILNGIKVAFHQQPEGAPRVLVAHLNVEGADAGGFTLIGQDVEVGWHALESTGADYIALGHIHKHQIFGDRVVFAGSPRRVDFGEEGETKGVVVAEVERGAAPVIQFVESPCREMQTIHVRDGRPDARVRPHAEVRVIIHVTDMERKTFDSRALMAEIGAEAAYSIRSEWNIQTADRIRSEAIQAAQTDRERFLAFVGQLDPPIDGAEAERLADMAEAL